MPDALLLLAVIVDKMFIQGQRIADNIPGDLDVKTTDLLTAAILHHPPRLGFPLEVSKNIKPWLLLTILCHLGATSGHQHRQGKRH